jgi:superfamily II DNA/RNA helicase
MSRRAALTWTMCEVVFNYDLPYDPEDYVHRIGRTGRAGKQRPGDFAGAVPRAVPDPQHRALRQRAHPARQDPDGERSGRGARKCLHRQIEGAAHQRRISPSRTGSSKHSSRKGFAIQRHRLGADPSVAEAARRPRPRRRPRNTTAPQREERPGRLMTAADAEIIATTGERRALTSAARNARAGSKSARRVKA